MIGERLTKLRKQKKLTQEEMAKKIGVHRGTYSNYESGNRNPDYETLGKIADILGVKRGYLLGDIDELDKPNLDDSDPTEEERAFLNDPYFSRFYKEMKDSPEDLRKEALEYIRSIPEAAAGEGKTE